MNTKELEVKILNVNIEDIKTKLSEIGASYKGEKLQKLFVYDVPSIRSTYLNLLDDIRNCKDSKKEKILIKKLKNIMFDIENIVTVEESECIKKVFNNKKPSEYLNKITKFSKEQIDSLSNDSLVQVVKKYDTNPNKWVRLRQSGEECTLTIKHILTSKDLEYDIDKLNEYEVNVSSLEMANLLLEQLNVVAKGYQEKYRISYKLDETEIEIDKWPLIPPYIEIEGKNVEKIYEVAQKLGYSKDEIKVMNTSEVYKIYGLNIYDYEELKFNETDKKEII